MGIRFSAITELATGLLSSHKIAYTTGTLTRLLRLDTLADWIIQTYASFTASGSGATAETVASVLDRFVYPQNYGAVCDGVTDDTDAFRKAVVYAAANGKTVLITGTLGLGTASWTGILLDTLSDFVIQMWPGASIKILALPTQTIAGSTVWAFKLSNCTRVRLIDLKFNANSLDCGLVGLTGCTECGVEKAIVPAYGGLSSAAIFSMGGTRNKFYGNRVTGNGTPTDNTRSRGIWIGNTNAGEIENQPEVTDNFVVDTQYTGIVTVATGGRVTGNLVDSAGGSGIIVSTATNAIGQFTVVANNTVRNCTTQGIQADNANSIAARALTITGNTVEGCGNAGLYLAGLLDSTISNNVIRNNGTTNGSGIQLDISGGIAVRDVIVSGNNIYDDTGNGTRQANGIFMQTSNTADGIRDVIIIGNQCRGHLVNGINLTIAVTGTSNHVSMIGNTCRDNAARGIDVSGASSHTNITLAFNTCHDNTTEDIRVQAASGLVYGSNNLYGSATLPFQGSATFNPANLADGAGETTTVTVSGAALGDYAEASFSLDLQGIAVTAWVSAANTVSVRFQNESGGALDLGSGTLRARVRKAL